MTVEELTAIIDGIVPFLREQRDIAKQQVDGLEREIGTVRESLRVAEGRRVDLETRCQALEEHVKALRLELEADRAVLG